MITIRPNHVSGAPCITGTRVTTEAIATLVRDGTLLDGILDMYPFLTAEQVRCAAAFEAGWHDAMRTRGRREEGRHVLERDALLAALEASCSAS